MNCVLKPLFIFRYWFTPLGLKLGIKNAKVKKFNENVVLEKEYQKESILKHKDILGLAKRLDWTERQVLRWFRIRKMQGKPTTLTKFCENRYLLFFELNVFRESFDEGSLFTLPKIRC